MRKAATAQARATKLEKKTVRLSDSENIEQSEADNEDDSDIECTGWTGGVNHVLSNTDIDSDLDDDDDEYEDFDMDSEEGG